MPKTRKVGSKRRKHGSKRRKHGRKHRKHGSIIPGPLIKGVRDINSVAAGVARSIEHYPNKAVRAIAGQVLKPRKLPGLRGGGTSCCSKLDPGAFGSSSTKKGGRKRRSRKRRGSRKTRR